MSEHKRIKILFLCTGNSCRSQMAQAWARLLKPDQIEAHSAGTEPKAVDPFAVKAMKEVGADMSENYPKHIDEIKRTTFDYVITVCDSAREKCPFFPAKTKVINVGFEDPPKLAAGIDDPEQKLNCYRRVRDQIKEMIEKLPRNLDKI